MFIVFREGIVWQCDINALRCVGLISMMNVGVGMFIFSCCFINSAFSLLRRKVLHRFFVEGHLGKVQLGRREGTGLRVSAKSWFYWRFLPMNQKIFPCLRRNVWYQRVKLPGGVVQWSDMLTQSLVGTIRRWRMLRPCESCWPLITITWL